MSRARDSQRQRVYRAELAAFSHDGDYWRQTITNGDLQPFVDRVMAMRAVQSRWGRRRIQVGLTHSGARGGGSGIRLGVQCRNEWVILHEVAHCLIPHDAAWHGPEFVGVFRFLVRTVLGEDAARRLAAACRDERVRATTAAVPKPTQPTVSLAAQEAAKRKAVKAEQDAEAARLVRRHTGYGARRETAAALRIQVKAGVFGAPNSTARKHALATARALEKS